MMSNAVKFTDEGSIKLKAVLVDAIESESNFVRISVADTGIGISEEDMSKLFERFSQVDSSTTRSVGGTGLGLSISRSLIELHGGEMGAESTVGKGTTFYVTLPLRPPVTEIDDIIDMVPNGDQTIVLAVDDDEGVLNLYQRFLENAGYAVVGLTSGDNVLQAVQQIQPFAIMLDIMMPGYDGWQIITDLKLNEATSHVPVILCTLVEEKERGLSLGAADYLLKPIAEDDLLAALERLEADGNGAGA